MALTGHLSDLSLSELIEFFCNQRKMGLLKVHYPQGSGSFFLQNGSVVDAQIGVLRGIDAVYYALTLPNAAFEFKVAAEPSERTINQPWTQVVLEGLRRLDEGIDPEEAFLNAQAAAAADGSEATDDPDETSRASEDLTMPAFLSADNSLASRKPLFAGLAAVAVLLIVAAIGIPAGWYRRGKPPVAATQTNTVATSAVTTAEPTPDPTQAQSNPAETDPRRAEADLAAKRQKEKEKKAREDKANAATAAKSGETGSTAGGKKVTVQVTFDESGRVVQASGADPTALRIARQKRFPAGKAGTATVTIPIN